MDNFGTNTRTLLELSSLVELKFDVHGTGVAVPIKEFYNFHVNGFGARNTFYIVVNREFIFFNVLAIAKFAV